jgi:hypothetical protein
MLYKDEDESIATLLEELVVDVGIELKEETILQRK